MEKKKYPVCTCNNCNRILIAISSIDDGLCYRTDDNDLIPVKVIRSPIKTYVCPYCESTAIVQVLSKTQYDYLKSDVEANPSFEILEIRKETIKKGDRVYGCLGRRVVEYLYHSPNPLDDERHIFISVGKKPIAVNFHEDAFKGLRFLKKDAFKMVVDTNKMWTFFSEKNYSDVMVGISPDQKHLVDSEVEEMILNGHKFQAIKHLQNEKNMNYQIAKLEVDKISKKLPH